MKRFIRRRGGAAAAVNRGVGRADGPMPPPLGGNENNDNERGMQA